MSTPSRPLFTLLPPSRRAALVRRARLLAGASVAYNVVEAVVAIGSGRIADSTALVGFGLDSTVEVMSGLVILWQFGHPVPEEREHLARRLIAVSFFALAAYVTVESVRAVVTREQSDTSVVGIALAALSLAVMPLLSHWQRRTGRELGSGAVVADGTQTLLCTYLSAVLLVGLLANALLGWWWLDPVAALVIAAVAVREGRSNWRGDACC
ncbi:MULTISPECIES: cation transporter [unclassified Terrabacter]|uniref:cation transporter n=1 Tax=unclassified Terrabacter TaxID=2630222 RepID=UPI000A6677FD|nr:MULTISPECIES: cation transporter [unclassified Terrabacter]